MPDADSLDEEFTVTEEPTWDWEWTGPFDPDAPPPEIEGPPSDLVPGSVQLDLALVRTAEVAVFLNGFRAYPTGVSYLLEIRVRAERRLLDPDGESGWQSTPGGLSCGFRLADQRVVSPEPRGWSASEYEVSADCWWPTLPPPGLTTAWCEWPDRGLPRTEQTFDATLLHEAAARAQPLWRQ